MKNNTLPLTVELPRDPKSKVYLEIEVPTHFLKPHFQKLLSRNGFPDWESEHRFYKNDITKKKGKLLMKTIEMYPSDKTFSEWANCEYAGLNLTEEEVGTLLGYVVGHGCGVYLDAKDTIIVVDIEDPENGIVAKGLDELIERVCTWNYELIQDSEVAGKYREQILMDAEMIDNIMERMGCRVGRSIGTPTVKELIAVLSKLPEDYRVTCCGADNFLYLFPQSKVITIDCERFIG